MKRLLPILIGLIIVSTFYYPFFFSKKFPIPLDIITGMYLPWMDLTRQIFPNGGPVKNPLPSDVVSLTLPLRFQSINILKHGEFPLWNPGIISGTPLLANFQSAVLNPLNILYWLPTDFIHIWSIQVILQALFAFIFFYFYISQYVKSNYSRLISSFIWTFNGFFAIWFQYNTVIYAAIVLPLAFYAVDKFHSNKKFGFLLAFSIAFSIFSGNPPVSLIVISVSCIYTVFKYYSKIHNIILLAAFFGIGLVYSLPQLLPGLDASRNSIRDFDQIATSANIKFMSLHKLITLSIPDYFGNPSTRNTWKNESSYDNSTLYSGILPFILLILSFRLFAKNKHRQLYQFSYFLLGSCLVLVIRNPLSFWLSQQNILGLSSMVFTRFSFVFSFALALISALVLDEIIDHKVKPVIILKSSLLVLLTIIIPAVITYIISQQFKHTLSIDTDWLLQSQTALRNCILPLIIFTSTFISLFSLVKLRHQLLQIIFINLIFIICYFDLFRFFQKYNTFASQSDYFPSTELTTDLELHSFRFARESAEIIPSNTWLMFPHLQTATGYDTTYSQKYGSLIALINGGTLFDHPNRYLEIDKFSSPLINQLSIDYIIATKKNKYGLSDNGKTPPSINPQQFTIIKDYGRYQLLKNVAALPFIYPVKQIIISSTTADTQKLLLQPNSSELAIINPTPDIPTEINSDVIINNLLLKTQSFSFTTQSNSQLPSFLRLSQNFDPNWHVYIDNIPHNIVETNYALTGILLPPGNHQVVFKYQSYLFDLCVIISLIAISASLLVIIYNLWPKHPQR